MKAAVDVAGLTKCYGRTVALDDISLKVERGELFGIIGPDGAGKSSLYRILATLSEPDKGSVSVLGLDPVRDIRRIRARIGYMPERFSLYPDLTVSENLRFFASLFGVTVDSGYSLIAPVFSQLARFPNRPAGRLSGGMKQKLALSCALIHRPELLLLDEPTTGVDAVSRQEFWDMLTSLQGSGITILVSTSYMDEATRCGRIAMIDSGHILDTGEPQSLVAGISECFYQASASDMFALLSALRGLPDIIDCYTFGASLHLRVLAGFDPDAACRRLAGQGIGNAVITPVQANIEDLFIKLTHDNAQQ